MPNKAITPGKYHFLDMGKAKYGECIVCIFGDLRILIDGGHPSDFDGQPGCRSIPDQLSEILGGSKFQFDLLVVTHCHDDHIGCLPELVRDEIVKAEWALVSDEKWGFGRSVAEDSGQDAEDFGLDDADETIRNVVAAMTEEDHSDLPSSELRRFVDAAGGVEPRYLQMLKQLETRGTKIIRHQRDKVTKQFLDKFASIGLEVLGPERAQLESCGASLANFIKAATKRAKKKKNEDAISDPVELYREMSESELIDMAGTSGPPKNNQSIVLAFGEAGQRILLAGDLQLANAQMASSDAKMMTALRKRIADRGPYVLVKALHHTSYNGQDDTTLDALGPPKFIIHSGGRNDSTHPDAGTLTLLKERRSDLSYARTDRNGIVEFTAKGGLVIEKGRENDFTANSAKDTEAPASLASKPEAVELPPAAEETTSDGVLLAWVPKGGYAKLRIGGIDVEVGGTGRITQGRDENPPEQEKKSPMSASRPTSIKFAGGRTLDKLLFVTDSSALARNIGRSEAQSAIRLIQDAGQEILELSPGAKPTEQVRTLLNAKGTIKGVVLLGGYDIVPSQRVDVLTPEMRQRLGDDTYDDGDNFIVWSDDPYGDLNADGLAEVPVSRIPDGRDGQLVFNALTAGRGNGPRRFGIRNVNRPFADTIWGLVPGKALICRSGPYDLAAVKAGDLNQHHIYLMLHGSRYDGRVFSGELANRSPDSAVIGLSDGIAIRDELLQDTLTVDALHARQIPSGISGVVLAGCCWGGLTVNDLAAERSASAPTPRVPEASIALSFIKSGVQAFVGCTGSHYSPDETAAYAGGPMHKLFWTEYCKNGLAPAPALARAKSQYLLDMPHGRVDLYDLAIERKILVEFTCLGLGW